MVVCFLHLLSKAQIRHVQKMEIKKTHTKQSVVPFWFNCTNYASFSFKVNFVRVLIVFWTDWTGRNPFYPFHKSVLLRQLILRGILPFVILQGHVEMERGIEYMSHFWPHCGNYRSISVSRFNCWGTRQIFMRSGHLITSSSKCH